MRIYRATYPFELDVEEGTQDVYSAGLNSLRRSVRQTVRDVVANCESELRYMTKPLTEPKDGRVLIELEVKIEEIETVPITRAAFCMAVNGGPFVQKATPKETIRFRFRVSAELFEDR